MSSTGKNLIVLLVLIVSATAIAVKSFGRTVSMKFSKANGSVESQVVFDADWGGSRGPTPHRDWPTPQLDPPAGTPPAELTSSFAIDVDTGSYTHARGYLRDGLRPPTSTIRLEEFVNYFEYAYDAPPAGKSASVDVEAAPSPFAADEGEHILRIGLQARQLEGDPPVHLTFLVDVSGSMSSQLDLAKLTMRTIAGQLAASDSVGIVTYAGDSRVALESTHLGGSGRNRVNAAIDALETGGGTAMGAGMELAYAQAVGHVGNGVVSRVVVLSDGDTNIGAGTPQQMLDTIRGHVSDGVTMSTIGFGMGNYRDDMMEQLADNGNGNYTYMDSAEEVERAFTVGLDRWLHVVAEDVKVQVEFDPARVEMARLVGYENREMSAEEFADDRTDAGELGAGQQATALYVVKLRPGTRGKLGVVRFRHRRPGAAVTERAELALPEGAVRANLSSASDDFVFQVALIGAARLLHHEPDVNGAQVVELAERAATGRPERIELARLLRRVVDRERSPATGEVRSF